MTDTKDLVDYATEHAKIGKKKKPIDKIKNCSFTGCPMNADAFINGMWMCCFHDSSDYHQDVTVAIRKNKSIIRTYNTMVRWKPADWKEHHKWLITKDNCPMGENEPRSLYILRYFNWISEVIKNDATTEINKRLQYTTGQLAKSKE